MSKRSPLRVPDYLRHMLQAIERIMQYVAMIGEAGFLEDEKTQDAVIRNIEIIGETAQNVEFQILRGPPNKLAYLVRNQKSKIGRCFPVMSHDVYELAEIFCRRRLYQVRMHAERGCFDVITMFVRA